MTLFLLIDWPARLIGNSIVPIYSIAGVAGSIAAGYFLSQWLSYKIGRPTGIVLGVLVGVYVATVIYRSQHWAAFALLSSMKD